MSSAVSNELFIDKFILTGVVDSPYDYKQLVFKDDVLDENRSIIIDDYNEKSYFLGFNKNLYFIQTISLNSSNIKFYGLSNNNDVFYEVINDTYLNFDSSKAIQITGVKREHLSNQLLYLGLPIYTTNDEDIFIPESWFYFNDDPFGSTQVPLVPTITNPTTESSLLIMQENGQKLYLTKENRMLIDTKGFVLNLSDTLTSTGSYDWNNKSAPTIEDTYSESIEMLPQDKIIRINLKNGNYIQIDDSGTTAKIEISLGQNTVVINEDEDIEINSNGNVVFNGGNKTIVAHSDSVNLKNCNYTLSISTNGTLSILYGSIIGCPMMGGAPIPVMSGSSLTLTAGSLNGSLNVLNGTIENNTNRKEKVE